jgi:hypothetical protein
MKKFKYILNRTTDINIYYNFDNYSNYFSALLYTTKWNFINSYFNNKYLTVNDGNNTVVFTYLRLEELYEN